MLRRATLAALLCAAACTSTERPPGDDVNSDFVTDLPAFDVIRRDVIFQDVLDVPDDVAIFEDAPCGARFARHDEDPGQHVPPDAMPSWPTNPPTSGPHYEATARWGVHRTVIPRGYWVHNLEHGGVAVLYRCESGCDALRAQLEAFVRALPAEPICISQEFHRRVLLTPDPLIETTIAAAAWGWSYRSDCFDAPSLEAFVLRRTGRGTKNLCADGTFPPAGSDL
jgi:hypothetical protein